MIRGRDLFGRPALSPHERKMIQSANTTAQSMFDRRHESPLKENWDIPAEEITLEMVERDVINAVKKKYGKDK